MSCASRRPYGTSSSAVVISRFEIRMMIPMTTTTMLMTWMRWSSLVSTTHAVNPTTA